MGWDCWLSPLVKGTLNASANQDTLDNFMLSTLWEQLGMSPSCWNMDKGVWCGRTGLAYTDPDLDPKKAPLG